MILRMPMNAHDTGVTADAVEFVREAIRSGRYLPGDRIVEREISEELGISSIAVRDAFARLTLEGWIERLPRRGVRVRPLDAHEIADISALRALLEGEAAARASARLADGIDGELADSALGLVEGIPAAMARAGGRRDRDRLLALDDAFHAALWHLAGSPTLEEMLQNLRARVTPMIRASLHLIDDAELPQVGEWHAELLAAIHEGPRPARAAAARHTDRTRTRVLHAHEEGDRP
jgi:DNA-binding GntR family transcriptional regulator